MLPEELLRLWVRLILGLLERGVSGSEVLRCV